MTILLDGIHDCVDFVVPALYIVIGRRYSLIFGWLLEWKKKKKNKIFEGKCEGDEWNSIERIRKISMVRQKRY